MRRLLIIVTGLLTLGVLSLFQNCAQSDLSRSLSESMVFDSTSTLPTGVEEPDTPSSQGEAVPPAATDPALPPPDEEEVPQQNLRFTPAQLEISEPFVLASGSVTHTMATSEPINGGEAYVDFILERGGNYKVHMIVTAQGTGDNSLFVDFDQFPATSTVWHIPSSDHEEFRTVSRGDDVDGNNPEHTFTLSQGFHRLYIVGREANLQFRTVLITALDDQGQVNYPITGPSGLYARNNGSRVLAPMDDEQSCRVASPTETVRFLNENPSEYTAPYEALLFNFGGEDCP